MAKVKISWGLDTPSGSMKHINEVPNGLACQCICPSCGSPLIARQGKIKWCFAHSVDNDCNGETALHKAAKQILVQEANSKSRFSLPDQKLLSVELEDLAGNKHSKSCADGFESILIVAGQEEVRVTESIQVDVLLVEENETKLSVEIFVTHVKDERDARKFQQAKINSIEIDLSHLAWDADYESIKREILKNAPRKWIFSAELENRKQKLTDDLQIDVISRNEKFFKDLNEFITQIQIDQPFNRLIGKWPVLSGDASGLSCDKSLYKKHHVTASTEIIYLTTSWTSTPIGMKCSAMTVEGEDVDLYMCLNWTEATKFIFSQPSFICNLGYKFHSSELTIINYGWQGIDEWLKRLSVSADEKLTELFGGQKFNYAEATNFAFEFRHYTDDEKMLFLSKRSNKISIKTTGPPTESPEWWGDNMTNIWKSIVILYKIENKKGQLLKVSEITNDCWLEKIIGWLDDDDSVKRRDKDLWHFFKIIERQGILQSISEQRSQSYGERMFRIIW